MLRLAQFAVKQTDLFGAFGGDKAKFSSELEQGEVAGIGGQLRVLMGVSQHQILHYEFDVHHAATVMFDVEPPAVVGVPVVHLLAHRQDILSQFRQVARLAKHAFAYVFESIADPDISRR